MDRLALLIGASPQRSRGGPITRLPAGRWLIHIHGLSDSILHLSVNGLHLDAWPGCELTIQQASTVQIMFAKRGNEPHIDAFAVRAA